MIYTKKMIWSILSSHMREKQKLYQDGTPQCYPEELVEHIVIELNLMEDTKTLLKRVSDEEKLRRDEFEQTLDDLARERENLRQMCNHHSIDVGTCDICGSFT
jgi:hypothetical protein